MIQVDKQNNFAWIWRFLFTWHWHHKNNFHWFIGFYPDYENCIWWYEIERKPTWKE